jgi:hypothetical protein
MADSKVTPLIVVPDASDFASLWLDPKLGDGIVSSTWNSVPCRA